MGAATEFVDSNVLVYAYDKSEGKKHLAAKKILSDCFQFKKGLAFSSQVLSEFFVAVTKKIEKPIPAQDAKQVVQKIVDFELCLVFPVTGKIVSSAVDSCIESKGHYWDCLIAETMKENKVYRILTENLSDFKKIPGISAVNPFK